MPAQYYFDELDPTAFQRLVNALLVSRYGEGIRLLPIRGADGGRDAEIPPDSAFFFVEIPPGNKPERSLVKPGRYLFQVKHHRLADRPGPASRTAVLQDFAGELSKNVIAQSADRPFSYFFLITNVPSSKDAVQRVDERRKELSLLNPTIHAEVLWQDHVTAWLDQTPSVWVSYPELFAGRTVPVLGQIATSHASGLSASLRLALTAQLNRDSIIRFRQINLEQRLPRLFVDLNARFYDQERSHFLFVDSFADMNATFLEGNLSSFSYSSRYGSPLVISVLANETHKSLSKIILEGGPGQGKSTVTQMLAQIYRSLVTKNTSEYLAYSDVVRKARLPIRIELRFFAEWLGDSGRSVEQFVSESFSTDAGGATISVEDIHAACRLQDVLLIFDGLDEVGSDSLRDKVVEKIVECVARLESNALESNVRVIVTSRPPAIAGRLDALSGFRRVQLQPLSESKVEEYLTRWTVVQCSDANDRNRVVQSFMKRKGEDHVAALVKNPMQLSVLLHFIRLKGEAFPDKRAELYREYFKTVIDRDVEKSPDLRRNRDDIETLHEVIGFTIHSRAEGASTAALLTRRALVGLVRKWFESEGRNPDLGESLFKIGEERLGLIMALSGEGESTHYGFEIQPVREYFAAAFINDKCEANAHDLFERMIRRPFWREVARFFAGLRRANERADLLSRARQLDQDPENGWRSDGLSMVLQLLQEGVFTTPGNVHREALGFAIESLDVEKGARQVEPHAILTHLPKMISACDSERPKSELEALLKRAASWTDVHDLRRIWSVANRVLPDSVLMRELASFEGDEVIAAEMKIQWPIEGGRRFLTHLYENGRLEDISTSLIGKNLYQAAVLDQTLRDQAICTDNHEALLEEFAFEGVFNRRPVLHAGSSLGIWQLCAWLHHAGTAIRQRQVSEDTESPKVRFSGLNSNLTSLLSDTIHLLRTVSSSPAAGQGKHLRDLLQLLEENIKGSSLLSLIAMRCATTLLGYVESSMRTVQASDGQTFWTFGRVGSVGSRSKAWQEFKKSLIPYFYAGIPKQRDSAGRVLSSQLASGDYFRGMQSHIWLDGEIKPIFGLICDAADSPVEWLARVPIQHYWVRSHLDTSNAESVLSCVARSPLAWASPVKPISQVQVGAIADVVRLTEPFEAGTAVLFLLQGSNIWGRFRSGTMNKVFQGAARNSGDGTIFFERAMQSRASIPQGLSHLARSIVLGHLATNSALTAAASRYMSEEKANSLAPLRTESFLAEATKSWYDASMRQ